MGYNYLLGTLESESMQFYSQYDSRVVSTIVKRL